MGEKKLSMQSSVIWNSAGSIFYLGCQWLMTVLVVRLSGIEAAGTFSLAMSVSNIWYCLAVYGMRNYQVSDTLDRYQTGTYIFSRLITGGAALIGCFLYTFIISYDPYQKICILLYFIFKNSEAFFDVYAGVFQKNWRLDYAGKSMVLRGILSLGSFVLVLKFTGNIMLTFGVMAVLCMGAVILYDIPAAKKLTDIKLITNAAKVKNLLKECFPLVVYTLMSSAIGTIPRLYMERLLGSYELGIYGSVATPTLIIQMGATYVFNPFVTLFAERYNRKEKEKFLSALKKCIAAVVVIAVAGIIGGRLLGVWGLQLLYGEEVARHFDLLIPLIICTVLTAFSWLLCGVLTAVREFRGLIAGNLLAVIASAALSPVFEKNLGMQGASLALALSTIIEILILSAFLWKSLRCQFEQ